jgi:hypothetical protein
VEREVGVTWLTANVIACAASLIEHTRRWVIRAVNLSTIASLRPARTVLPAEQPSARTTAPVLPHTKEERVTCPPVGNHLIQHEVVFFYSRKRYGLLIVSSI